MLWRTVAAVLLAALCWAGNPMAVLGQNYLSRDQILEAGRAALREQHYTEAIHLLEDGLKRFPRDQEIKVELGRAYLFDRQDDRAIGLFKEVLKEEPSNRMAKLQLARTMGYHRDYEASSQLFSELLQAHPDDEAAALGLIRNLMHQDRTAEARRQLDLALAHHPHSKFLKEYKERLDKGRKMSGGQSGGPTAEPAGGRRPNRVQDSESYLSDSGGNRYLRSAQLFDYEIGHGLVNRLQAEERSSRPAHMHFRSLRSRSGRRCT